MFYACLKGVRSYLPETILTNDELANIYPSWTADKIVQKTGIKERRIAAPGECASDMAVNATEALFASGLAQPKDIDFVLLCTQSPDYFLPTTACMVQHRLGLPTRCGALDFNLGCSGYVYGLGLAKGLIESGQAQKILLVTAETYSKYIHPEDKSVRTLFGDAATASLVEGVESSSPFLGPFIYGTDGSGAHNLIVETGGMRNPRVPGLTNIPEEDEAGNVRSRDNLYMNGGEIFNFTLSNVPAAFKELLHVSGIGMESVDHFIFHQANKMMLDALRRKSGIPEDRFITHMDRLGNTVSSTLPLVLEHALTTHRIRPGQTVAMIGFGVGYSWASTMLRL